MKDAHCSVADVILHHLTVGDSLFDVLSRVLENASGTIKTLVRTVDEVLANRSQVLLVQVLFPLKFLLSVGEPTAHSIGQVFASLAL